LVNTDQQGSSSGCWLSPTRQFSKPRIPDGAGSGGGQRRHRDDREAASHRHDEAVTTGRCLARPHQGRGGAGHHPRRGCGRGGGAGQRRCDAQGEGPHHARLPQRREWQGEGRRLGAETDGSPARPLLDARRCQHRCRSRAGGRAPRACDGLHRQRRGPPPNRRRQPSPKQWWRQRRRFSS
jgi:hypothetical protein